MKSMSNKKRIFILISDLNMGGAQKSLLSFLRTLVDQYPNEYDIDLMICSGKGKLLDQVPAEINILRTPKVIEYMWNNYNFVEMMNHRSFKGIVGKVYRKITKKFFEKKYNALNDKQITWMQWKRFVNNVPGEYDCAISYLEGTTNYLLVDKVQATKKILWIHTEYDKFGFDPEFDKYFFSKADIIATISKRCVDNLLKYHSEYKYKIRLLENIVSEKILKEMASTYPPAEIKKDCVNILSIGRLNKEKQFELAVEAALLLQEDAYKINWMILGDGPEKEKLQSLIETLKLKNITLLGSKTNPYPYYLGCDIFVQTSKFEGKSIVLDEAKIFCKPIVVTNYNTVADNISNEVNGLIVNMNSRDIASGIERLVNDSNLKNCLCMHLKNENNSNEYEVRKYVDAIN